MSFRYIVAITFLSIVVSMMTVRYFYTETSSGAQISTHPIYDRVMETRTLRCGYGIWEPVVMKDPNTGEMSGLFVDIVEEMGDLMNIKIEWTEEIDWGQIPTALQAGKFDAHCAGMWASPKRGLTIAFTDPLFYTPIVTVVRQDDNRFNDDLSLINSPDVTISTGDDDIYVEIARLDYPQAKTREKSPLTGEEQHYVDLAAGRVDVAMGEPNFIRAFQAQNPDKIKIIHPNTYIRLYANTVAIDIREQELAMMLNNAIQQMVLSGRVQKILQDYKGQYDIEHFLAPQKPY